MQIPSTLTELILAALRSERDEVLRERRLDRPWQSLSARRLRDRASAVACALRDAGVKQGDRVGILSNNRIDWLVADYGILFAGAVVVPMYPTLAADQLAFVARDSGMTVAFVEHTADAERFAAAAPALRTIVFESTAADGLAAFESRGTQCANASGARPLADFTAGIRPNDLAVLIYTSGTTGEPKGVMLSHRNLVSNVVDAFAPEDCGIRPGDFAFSVLPLAHIYEHTVSLGYLHSRCVHTISVPERLLDDIRSARPNVAGFVPRIFERVLSGVIAKAQVEGGLRARLVPWALAVGREYHRAIADGISPSPALAAQYAIARGLVLQKLRRILGLDRARYLVSGSAKLHRDVALTFAGMGVPVCEGYGQTETSPVVSVNRVAGNRYGTVGKPIRNVEVRIAADGEVLVRGPNVMLGYYHRDESPIIEDGWLCTGDIGELDADGYLCITDRKKELFKTSGGKYISPARVEAAIKRSIYIGQVVIVGDGRPHPAALVAPNWDLVRRELGIGDAATTPEIAERPDVHALLAREVLEATKDLAPYERVHRVGLLPHDLTIEGGDLSPTLKVKRRVVESRYGAIIDAAYARAAAAVS